MGIDRNLGINNVNIKDTKHSVKVADKPGAISIISAILAAGGINIKNVGINHNRESGAGALRIEFYDASSCISAVRKLRDYNYEVVQNEERDLSGKVDTKR